MVKFALPLVALALATSVAAAPQGTSKTTFSFEQWVEDIIANPDTALTVDEAIAAAQAADVVGSAGGLQKRGRDAAACVDDLARKGRNGVVCTIGQNVFDIQMCRIGGARIVGSKSNPSQQSANCNDVARTAGIVFDNCWRSDDTIVGSEICVTNNQMQINVLGI
ncbi:hypothetical protein MMYC01_204064 [Madurella mycetomatis]|uniref:Uncharacterized protein n=1 Tax=Madurella mycetomatis TaxID=100816 RepID=A0A175W722_9PEZI|nr:hypothetical protein MMYC01_204064 [Madurella mycetomatis]